VTRLPKNIVVTYTDQFQELSGRLQSQSGAPATDYTILVFPEDKAYWIHGSRRIVTRGRHRRQVLAVRTGPNDAAAGDGICSRQ
jgi:hypothetical protein